LIGLSLAQKESIIAEFEKELAQERQRREQMFNMF